MSYNIEDAASARSTDEESSTKKDKGEMLNFIDEPMDSLVGDIDNQNASDSSEDLVESIVKAADSRKAEDIVVLKVNHVSTLTSYLVILSGNSRPQNQAIAAAIQDAVEEDYDGMKPGGNGVPEGTAESGWMLLDYGSVMCHVMTPKSRLFYNIEGQWRDKGGTPVDFSDVLIPNKVIGEDTTSTASSNYIGDDDDDDPFWS